MNKYTFAVDVVVHDESVDISEVAAAISDSVNVDGLEAVVKTPTFTKMSDQGYKVWRARVAGIKVADVEKETEGVA